jgi:hypothetical protein
MYHAPSTDLLIDDDGNDVVTSESPRTTNHIRIRRHAPFRLHAVFTNSQKMTGMIRLVNNTSKKNYTIFDRNLGGDTIIQ